MSVLIPPTPHHPLDPSPSAGSSSPSATLSTQSACSTWPEPSSTMPPDMPIFTVQLTAATTGWSPSPTSDDDNTSATGDLPYTACELKRVRFPCPVAEAERFASTHLTYSPAEYDRTPILISEEGRSCALPARGSKRCYFYTPADEVDDVSGPVRGSIDEVDDSSEGESDSSLSNTEEDELMDRRIAMMRSMGLAAAGVALGMADGGDDSDDDGRIEYSTTPSPDVEAAAVGEEAQRELDDELLRIRERCRTRFGLWRVETAEFASEDPNACGSPREPCTPNPSPMSPPASLVDGAAEADGDSPTPPAVTAAALFSYFQPSSATRSRSASPSPCPSPTAPIAIPTHSSSRSSSLSVDDGCASSFDAPASATPTSSLVGLSLSRWAARAVDDDDDQDETDSPASLGAASPATRRMMWCEQMKLRCVAPRLPTVVPAHDDEEEETEEHRDDSRGMRRWLTERHISDSPPPSPGWDDGASSFLAGRPTLCRTNAAGGGFPFTRVAATEDQPTNASSSTVHLVSISTAAATAAFEKRSSPPSTPSTASLLRSALAPSPPSPIEKTPTAASDSSSTPTTTAPASVTVDLVAPLSLLASPSSSACSSSDTGSFSTDSDPPSLASLRGGEDDEDDRWDLHRELSASPCFRSRSSTTTSTGSGDKLDLFGAGGWAEGGEASEFILGSRGVW